MKLWPQLLRCDTKHFQQEARTTSCWFGLVKSATVLDGKARLLLGQLGLSREGGAASHQRHYK